MKKTIYDVLKLLELKVGDKIIFNEKKYIIIENDIDNDISLKNNDELLPLTFLLGRDFEKIKTLGDQICNRCCRLCPLLHLNCDNGHSQPRGTSLHDILDDLFSESNDVEIYSIYKKRLNKEIE